MTASELLLARRKFCEHLPFPSDNVDALPREELVKQFGIKEYSHWRSNEHKVDKIIGWIKAIPEW